MEDSIRQEGDQGRDEREKEALRRSNFKSACTFPRLSFCPETTLVVVHMSISLFHVTCPLFSYANAVKCCVTLMPIETFSSMYHVTKLLPSITALFYPLSMPRVVAVIVPFVYL